MTTTLPPLISTIIETSSADADRNGIGVELLNSMGYSWVLSRFCVEIRELPSAEDELSIRTWVSDFGRVLSTRNFEVVAGSSFVAHAISQWCVIDLKARRGVDLRPFAELYKTPISEPRAPIDMPRKIVAFTPTHSARYVATEEDIDFNGHVHSIRYLELMFDGCEELSQLCKSPLRVDLQFIKECYKGEEMVINRAVDSEGLRFEILHTDGSVSARAVVSRVE